MSKLNNQIKKYNVTIPKLFETILKLNQEQQVRVLTYAEKLLVKDKRMAVRKACHITVSYATSNKLFLDHVINISKSGLFIETQKPLIVGDEVLMSFNMQGYDRPIKIKGEIVYANRLGVGVAYKEISPYIAEMIDTLVKRIKD
jgi:Tfp pilus assembly protein PilZ